MHVWHVKYLKPVSITMWRRYHVHAGVIFDFGAAATARQVACLPLGTAGGCKIATPKTQMQFKWRLFTKATGILLSCLHCCFFGLVQTPLPLGHQQRTCLGITASLPLHCLFAPLTDSLIWFCIQSQRKIKLTCTLKGSIIKVKHTLPFYRNPVTFTLLNINLPHNPIVQKKNGEKRNKEIIIFKVYFRTQNLKN